MPEKEDYKAELAKFLAPVESPNAIETAPFSGTKSINKEDYDSFFQEGAVFNNAGLSDARANNQSYADVWGNGLARLGGKTLSNLGETAGYLYGGVAGLATWNFDNVINNGLVNFFHEVGQEVTDATPIYSTQATQDSDLFSWDNLTSAKFLLGDLLGDGGSFLLSAWLTGAGMGKLIQGLGSKGIGNALFKSATNGEFKTLSAAERAIASKLNNLPKSVASAVAAYTEGSFEARQTYDDIYNKLKTENPNISDIEAKDKAIDGAKKTLGLNMLTIPLYEYQFASLFKSPATSRRIFKEALKDTQKAGKVASVAKGVGNVVKDFAKTGVIEGSQEGIQEAIQDVAKTNAGKNTDILQDTADVFRTFLTHFTDRNYAESMLSGFLIGAPFGAVQGASERKDTANKADFVRQQLQNNVGGMFADGATIKDENGTSLSEKGKKLLENASAFYHLEELKNKALENGDESSYKLLRELQFANLSYAKFEAGLGERLQDELDIHGSKSVDEWREQGMLEFEKDPQTNAEYTPREIADRYKQKAIEYEDIYNTLQLEYPNNKDAWFEAVTQKLIKESINKVESELSIVQSGNPVINKLNSMVSQYNTLQSKLNKTVNAYPISRKIESLTKEIEDYKSDVGNAGEISNYKRKPSITEDKDGNELDEESSPLSINDTFSTNDPITDAKVKILSSQLQDLKSALDDSKGRFIEATKKNKPLSKKQALDNAKQSIQDETDITKLEEAKASTSNKKIVNTIDDRINQIKKQGEETTPVANDTSKKVDKPTNGNNNSNATSYVSPTGKDKEVGNTTKTSANPKATSKQEDTNSSAEDGNTVSPTSKDEQEYKETVNSLSNIDPIIQKILYDPNAKTTVTNFAYLSAKYIGKDKEDAYDESGKLIIEEGDNHKRILSNKEFQQGDQIVLYIDKTNPEYEKLANDESNVPIGISLKRDYDSGNTIPIAYLHTLEWVSKEANNVAPRTQKLVEEQTKKLRTLVFNNEQPINTHIDSKSLGFLNTLKDTTQPVSNISSDEAKIVIGETHSTVIGSNKKALGNIIPGMVYFQIPTPIKNTYFNSMVKVNKVGQEADTILRAIESYIFKQGVKVSGYNLDTVNGLRGFINDITFVGGDLKNRSAKTLTIGSDENNYLIINFGTSGVFIEKGSGRDAGNWDSKREALKAVLQEKPKAVLKKYLLSNDKYEHPVFENKDFRVKSYKSYQDYLGTEVVNTNLDAIDLPDGSKSYFVQPNVAIATNITPPIINREVRNESPFSKEELSPKKEDQEIAKPAREKYQVDASIEGLGDIVDDLQLPSFSTDLNKYIAKDLSLEQQQQITDTVVSNLLANTDKGKSVNEAFDHVLQMLKSQYNKFVDSARYDKADLIKSVIDNWNSSDEFIGFTTLAEIKLAKMKITISEDELTDEETSVERRNYSESAVWATNPKDTASSRLKRFLSFITVVDKNGNPVPSIIGTKTYYDYDQLWNKIMQTLADMPIDNMMAALSALAEEKPEYKEVYNKIIEADEQLKNEFLSNFRLRYSEFETLNYAQDKNEISGRPSITNYNSATKIIVQQWFENFKNAPILDLIEDGEEIGSLKVNTIKANVLLDTVLEIGKQVRSESRDYDKLSKIFERLGIDIDPRVFEYIDKRGDKLKGINPKVRDLKTYINYELQYIFKELAGKETRESKEAQIPLEQNNPFINQPARINLLASLQRNYREDLYSSSFRNGQNNSIFAYNKPTHLTDTIMKLREDEGFAKDLASTAFASSSTWLKDILDKNSNFNKVFAITYFDSANKIQSNDDPLPYSQMNDKLRQMTKLLEFQNQGHYNKETNSSTAKFIDLAYSDKEMTTVITAPKVDVFGSKREDNKVVLNNTALDALYQVALGELKRIRLTQQQIDDESFDKSQYIKDYHDGAKAGMSFFLFRKLNNASFFEDGRLKDKAFEDSSVEKEIKDLIQEELSEWIKNKEDNWYKQGIISFNGREYTMPFFDKTYVKNNRGRHQFEGSGSDFRKNFIDFALIDYVTNYAITYGNMMQLVHGDMALAGKSTFDKTVVNYFKRLAKDIAPGTEVIFNDKTFNTVYINDVEIGSTAVDRLRGIVSDEVLDAYGEKINGTDAQEVTTVKEHIDVMFGRGLMSPELHNSISNKIQQSIDDKTHFYKLTKEELEIIMNPMKPVHVNMFIENGINKISYIKTSSYPLIPELTAGRNMDKLRLALEKGDVQRAVYNSGVKLGLQRPISLYNADGTINANLDKDISSSKVRLSRDGFKIQQDNPLKKKLEILQATQQRKLLFADTPADVDFNGVSRTQLKEKYDDLHTKLTIRKFEKLKKRFGAVKTESGNLVIEDFKEFQDLIKSEAIERGWSINELAALELDENGKFKVPLLYAINSDKIESLLTSLITNNIVKNKLPGHSYIQASSIGFEMEDRNVFTDPALQYMVKDKDGSYYSEVAIAWNFKDKKGKTLKYEDYVNEDGSPKENLSEELQYLVGYRIPNQGHNSMMRLKVVRYMHPNVGDLMLVPSEVTMQMGSDFDVDKMYSYNYAYELVDGKLKRTSKSVDEVKEKYASSKASKQALLDEMNKAVEESYSTELTQEINKLMGAIFDEDLGEELTNEELEAALKEQGYSKRLYDSVRNSLETTEEDYIEMNTDNIYKNEIIDINHTVLGNEKMIEKQMQPLGFVNLQAEADRIYSIVSKDLPKYSILYDEVSDQAFSSNRGGKLLTALSSLSSTHHALAQDAGLHIAGKTGINFKDDDGNIYTDVPEGNSVKEHTYETRRDENKKIAPNYPDLGAWRLDKIVGFTGKSILGVVSEIQSAAVDNAKEQLLNKANLGEHTYNIAALIARAGFDETFIVPFLNQPIIREYVKAMEASNDPTLPFDQRQRKSQIGSKFLKMAMQAAKTGSLKDNALSRKEMNDALIPNKTEAYYLTQAKVMDAFLSYSNIADQLASVQSAMNVESNGIGKSLSEAKYKSFQVDALPTLPFMGNVQKLFQSTIAGVITDYGLNKGNILFSNLFPYFSNGFTLMEDAILEDMGKVNSANADLFQEIHKEIKAAVYAREEFLNISNIEEERQRILISEYTIDKKSGNKVFTHKSLAQRLLEVQDKNRFFKKLSPKLSTTSGDLETMAYQATSVEESGEALMNSIAWQEALNSSDNEIKSVATDLIKYAYLIGGVQTASSFIKYAPVGYIVDTMKIGDKGVVDFSKADQFVNFPRQFFQNNPSKAKRINDDYRQVTLPKKDEFFKDVPNYFVVKSVLEEGSVADLFVRKQIGTKKEEVLPDYISVFSKELKKNVLFELSKDGLYKRIPTLGGEGIREYNLNHSIDKSIISKNNVGIKTETPKIEEISPIIQPDTKSLKSKIDTQPVSEVLMKIANRDENVGKPKGVLALHLLSKLPSDIDITFKEVDAYRGLFDTTGIIISTSKNPNIADMEEAILHEVMHFLTYEKIRKYEKGEVSPNEKDAFDGIKELITFMQSAGKDKVYEKLGLSTDTFSYIFDGNYSIDEFISFAMSNPNMQEALMKINLEDTSSLWDKFVQLVKDILGLNFGNNALTKVVNDVLIIIDSPSAFKEVGVKEEIASSELNLETIMSEGKVITLNQQQSEALADMRSWLVSNERAYTLSGYAGTGKSTIAKNLIDFATSKKKDVAVSAPTHKAKNVIGNKSEKDAFTLQSLLGLSPGVDLENFDPNRPEFKKQKDAKIMEFDLIVIDEASMINKNLFDALMKEAKFYGVKLLFMGDSAQLPPVGETESVVFNSPDITRKSQLTKVERQADGNPLMTVYDGIRGNITSPTDRFDHITRLNSKGEGIEFSNSVEDFRDAVVKAFTSEEYKKDSNYAKFLTYTNENVGQWNKYIRKAIFGSDVDFITIGDRLMAYSSIQKGHELTLENSSDYEVVKIGDIKEYEGIKVRKTILKDQENALFPHNIVIPTDENVRAYLKKHNDLLEKAKAIPNSDKYARKIAWAEYYGFKNEYLLIQNVVDSNNKLLATKSLDYAYAITTHKSQGSTYTQVFVNENDIDRNPKNKERNQLKYVAFSRPSEKATVLSNKTGNKLPVDSLSLATELNASVIDFLKTLTTEEREKFRELRASGTIKTKCE